MDLTLPVASYHPNPLNPTDGRVFSFDLPMPGEVVAEYIDRMGWAAVIDRPSRVFLDGKFLTREQWLEVEVLPGQRLSAHAALADDESDIGRTLLQIGVMALAFWAAGPLAATLGIGGTVGTAVVTSALMIGGNLILNSLMPPPTNDNSESKDDPTYSLSGGSNNLRPYDPLPWPMGVIKMFPDIDEKPYTYFNDEDQFLHQCFNFGIGTMELSDFRIGDSLATDLGVNNLEVGRTAVTNIDTAAGNVLTAAVGNVTRTSPVDTVEIAVDIGGVLVAFDNKGKPTNLTADFVIEYSPAGANTWSAFVPDQVTTGYTPDNWEEVPASDLNTPPPLGASTVPWVLMEQVAGDVVGGG